MRGDLYRWLGVLLLGVVGAGIRQGCSFIEPCPSHAECNPLSNFCVCEEGFIDDCQTPAEPISEYPQIVELPVNSSRLFYMRPIAVDESIEFTLRLCREKQKENVPILLRMWRDDGSSQGYLSNNTMSPATDISFDSQCYTLSNKYIVFQRQPNGDSEMLIVGVANNWRPLTLTLTATQKLVLGLTFYYFIMVGLMVFVSVLALISAVIFMLRRGFLRRFIDQGAAAVLHDNEVNLDHFDLFMPSLPTPAHLHGQSCPICLQDLTSKEEVRTTPCDHAFHTNCLDYWCRQNLSCPVCRSDLSADAIAAVQKALPQRTINESGYQEKWEEEQMEVEMIERAMERVEERGGARATSRSLRQGMLSSQL
jgi:hypothetical protein